MREDDAINVGQVLDAHGRSYYSLHQMANLVALLHDGDFTNDDVIFSEDLFQPGFAALPYILAQLPPKADQGFSPVVWRRVSTLMTLFTRCAIG